MIERRMGGERGTSAVEFALVVSLLFIVLFGIIQFGIAYNRYQSINASAREGARLGSLQNTQLSAIQNRVLESLSILNANNFKSSGTVVSTCPPTLSVETGCIEVSKEDKTSPGTYLSPLTASDAVACNQEQQGFALKVVVKYRMRITIPLWASPAVNATGTGVFRCE